MASGEPGGTGGFEGCLWKVAADISPPVLVHLQGPSLPGKIQPVCGLAPKTGLDDFFFAPGKNSAPSCRMVLARLLLLLGFQKEELKLRLRPQHQGQTDYTPELSLLLTFSFLKFC
jgi:hypothetical protein